MQFAPTLTKTCGSHTFEVGYDWRQLRQAETNLGWKAGAYAFDGSYTRSTSCRREPVRAGHRARSCWDCRRRPRFIETRSNYDARVNSHGAFVHDDWRVSDRLTLNLGVRYDLELGLTEVENRNIGGFDLTTSNPIEAQARANFRGESARGRPDRGVGVQRARRLHLSIRAISASAWNADTNNFQPRAGFTYKLSDKSVLRGGAGLFIAPFQIQGVPRASRRV